MGPGPVSCRPCGCAPFAVTSGPCAVRIPARAGARTPDDADGLARATGVRLGRAAGKRAGRCGPGRFCWRPRRSRLSCSGSSWRRLARFGLRTTTRRATSRRRRSARPGISRCRTTTAPPGCATRRRNARLPWRRSTRRRRRPCPCDSPRSSRRRESGLPMRTGAARSRQPNSRDSGSPPGGACCRTGPARPTRPFRLPHRACSPNSSGSSASCSRPRTGRSSPIAGSRTRRRRAGGPAQGSPFETHRARRAATAGGGRTKPAAGGASARGAARRVVLA